MARPLRIQFDDAWYHVINRGARRKAIFDCDYDRQIFIDLLETACEKYRVEIHAYCLMDNHYHLLIKTPFGNLSKVMRHINGLYTQRFNRKYGFDGPLFRGRYKAIIIDSENYLLAVTRYIHMNPVAAGITNHPKEHKWSSYRAYLSGQNHRWLSKNEILSRFNREKAVEELIKFTEQDFNIDDDLFDYCISNIPILGSEEYIEEIANKHFEDGPRNRDIPQEKTIKEKLLPSTSIILNVVSNYFRVPNEILTAKKCGKINMPRYLAIYLSSKLTLESHSSIAACFSYAHSSSVTMICEKIKKLLKSEENINCEAKKLENIVLRETRKLKNKT